MNYIILFRENKEKLKKEKIMKKIVSLLFLLASILLILAGCSNTKNVSSKSDFNTTLLESKKLFIYCGAGMKNAAQELVSTFKENTKAEVSISYGNAANIISQITTSKEGDIFIAGDVAELKALQDKNLVSSSANLVKHIPVLVVKKGNPKGIKSLSDLSKSSIKIVLGDNAATPIGKLSDKSLSDLKIIDKVNIVSRSATANEMTTSITLGQCDAIITWKESVVNVEGIEIVNTDDLKPYIKIVPAATLSYSINKEATQGFINFLKTDQAKSIWKKHGYEMTD